MTCEKIKLRHKVPVRHVLLVVLTMTATTNHSIANPLENYHTFTDTTGRNIEAKVLGYDPDGGQVKLERKNGAVGTIATDTLSTEDKDYLESWLVGKYFMSSKLIDFKVKYIRGNRVRKGDEYELVDRFDIYLTNTGNTSLEGLFLDICRYEKDKDRVDTGSFNLEIGDLAAKATLNKDFKFLQYSKDGRSSSRIVGARFKLFMPTATGELLCRDACAPILSESHISLAGWRKPSCTQT